MEEQTKKLKKKIRELKQEISYLNNVLIEADEGSWDNKGIIEDALNGTWNGQIINTDCKPDLKYAKWLAQRYGYKIIEDGDGDMEVIEQGGGGNSSQP